MHPIERVFKWAGGAIFVGALAFCAYTFIVVWSREAGLERAAVAADGLLFSIFAIHHSVFAREPVKGWIARLVPERLVRAMYVWVASLLLMSVCMLWRTIGGQGDKDSGGLAGRH